MTNYLMEMSRMLEEFFPIKRKFTNLVQFVAEVDGVYVVALQI